MNRKKSWLSVTKGFPFLLVLLGLVAGRTEAAPVTQEQAARAVHAYLSRTPAPLGAKVGGAQARQTRTHNREGQGTPLFHVVTLEGGGFVVTSADTGISPIIAISAGDDLVESEQNPLWVLLNRDLPQRMDALAVAVQPQMQMAAGAQGRGAMRPRPRQQWDALFAEEMPVTPNAHTAALDVRVEPLVKSEWSQTEVWTNPNGLKPVYNYYTPNGSPCGCVATAGAQILRFHEYPKAPVTPKTYTCWVNDVPTDLTMKGGVYDWANMTLVPQTPPYNISDISREAIGRLTYDVGVAAQMQYAPGSSGAFNWVMLDGLKDAFGYASGVTYWIHNGTSLPADSEAIRNAVLGSLDAGLPAALGISNTSNSGHSVVADGYGYDDGILYVHLNLGWGGQQDAWYNFEAFDVSSNNYTLFDDVSYNIHPTETGEYITGRTLDSTGAVAPGATVTASNTVNGATYTALSSANGIYAIRVPSSTATYAVTATSNSERTASKVTVSIEESTMCNYFWFEDGPGMRLWLTPQHVGNSWGNDLTLQPPSTSTAPTPVPYEWLNEMFPANDGAPETYETLALSLGANGYAVWESYVAGLIPTNAASRFVITNFVMNANGSIALDWTPHRGDRVYTVWGKTNLTDKAWYTPTNSASTFFRVKVELP